MTGVAPPWHTGVTMDIWGHLVTLYYLYIVPWESLASSHPTPTRPSLPPTHPPPRFAHPKLENMLSETGLNHGRVFFKGLLTL